MKVNKISLVEAIALIVIITINKLSINLPQSILTSCGSSAILNVIFISIITILITFIIVKLFEKFPNSDIIDVSEFLGGKFLKYLIGVILFIYITFICAMLLRDYSETIHILYYMDTPTIYLLGFFIIVCAISNLFGGKSIIKTNVILCSILVISLIISFLAVLPNLTPQRIFPILGYGAYNTFFSGISNISAFNGLLVLYLVPSMLKDTRDLKKASMIAVTISAILLMLATASLLLAFSFSTQIDSISSLYTLLATNEFGRYFNHPESVFVLTWTLSFMTYVNVVCMLSVNILQKLSNVKNGKPFVIPICIIILGIAMIPESIMKVRSLNEFMLQYFATPLVFILLPVILVIANLKYKKSHKNISNISSE